MWDCGLIRFIWMKIEGCPQIVNVSFSPILLWKSNPVLIRTRHWVSIQSFCSMPKFSHVNAQSSSRPAGTAASSTQALLGASLKSAWLRVTWLLRPHGCCKEKVRRSKYSNKCYREGEGAGEGEGEGESLWKACLYILWLGKDQVLLQTNQSTSQALRTSMMSPPPHQPIS